MEERRIRVYDGSIHDEHDEHISDRFLLVKSCGMGVDSYMNTIRPHGRADYQLIYVESGTLEVLMDGTRHTVAPGGFILYKPREIQNYLQKKGRFYWVHFSGSAAEETLRSAGLAELHICHGKGLEEGIRIAERELLKKKGFDL